MILAFVFQLIFRLIGASIPDTIKGESHRMATTFTKRPTSVNMTYLKHMGFAIWLSLNSFTCCIVSLVHSFFLFLFETYTRRQIANMNQH